MVHAKCGGPDTNLELASSLASNAYAHGEKVTGQSDVEIWPTARHFEQGRCPLRSSPPRVLLVPGSSRNDGTCPKELSKSWRLAGLA